ncbi:MAG: hypothetical protein HRT44_02020 [Bdellovibrionales bacterium]|nr:hypothetical protein [Bdellovibrionales bacterium]
MRFGVVFLLIFLIFPTVGFAKNKTHGTSYKNQKINKKILYFQNKKKKKAKWGYKAFPLVKPSKRDYLPKRVKIGRSRRNSLKAIMPKGSGTHPLWGVEQLYSNRQLSKYVAVKKNVKLVGKNVLGGWRKLNKGHVLHIRRGKRITAYYARGLSNRERFFFESYIRRAHKVSDFINPFIQKAYAETTSGGAVENPTLATGAAPMGPLGIARDAALCMGARARDAALETGAQTITAVGDGIAAAWDDPMGAAQAAGEWLWETGEAAYNGAGEAISGAIDTGGAVLNGAYNAATAVGTSIINGTVLDDIGDGIERTVEFLQRSYTHLANAISGFAELPGEVQAEILCHFGIQAAQTGLVALVMGATGAGVALAGARLASFATNFARGIIAVMPAIRAVIAMEDLSLGEKVQRIRDLLRNGNSEEQTQREGEQDPSNPNGTGGENTEDPDATTVNPTPGTPTPIQASSLELGERLGSGAEKTAYDMGDGNVAILFQGYDRIRNGNGSPDGLSDEFYERVQRDYDEVTGFANSFNGMSFNGRPLYPNVGAPILDDQGRIVGYMSERVEGTSFDRIASQLTPGERQEVMRQADAQLAMMYERGLIHGDANSGNLMVHRAPDGSIQARFIDFTAPAEGWTFNDDYEVFTRNMRDAGVPVVGTNRPVGLGASTDATQINSYRNIPGLEVPSTRTINGTTFLRTDGLGPHQSYASVVNGMLDRLDAGGDLTASDISILENFSEVALGVARAAGDQRNITRLTSGDPGARTEAMVELGARIIRTNDGRTILIGIP